MKWGTFFITGMLIFLILLLQWPKMKNSPIKDKLAFISLLLIGWVLSMFDLMHISGPVSWLDTLTKPLTRLLEV